MQRERELERRRAMDAEAKQHFAQGVDDEEEDEYDESHDEDEESEIDLDGNPDEYDDEEDGSDAIDLDERMMMNEASFCRRNGDLWSRTFAYVFVKILVLCCVKFPGV